MFVTLTLNPTIDRTVTVDRELSLGGVHRVVAEVDTPGGKGTNVAKAIAAAGGNVTAAGLVGDGERGLFEEFFAGAGIGTDFMAVPFATRVNVMVNDGAGREIKVNRDGFPGYEPDWPRLEAYCRGLAPRADVVLMGGALPCRFPDDTYARLVRLFHEAGVPTALDASGAALVVAAPAGPDVIKPNRAELAELVGADVEREEALMAAIDGLRGRHEVVAVSDGSRGAYFAAGGETWFGAAPQVAAVDTTGAGDALLGWFCACYFPTRRLTAEAIAGAVAAGAAMVELRGTPLLQAERVRELARRVKVERL